MNFGLPNLERLISEFKEIFSRDIGGPLKQIEKNTKPKEFTAATLADIIVLSGIQVSKKILVTANYLVFLGPTTSSTGFQDVFDSDSIGLLCICQVGAGNQRGINLRPGDSLPIPRKTPGEAVEVLITGGALTMSLWFLQTDIPTRLEGSNLVSPFVKNGMIRRVELFNDAIPVSFITPPFFRLQDADGDEADIAIAGGDGLPNSITGHQVYSRNNVFNGTNWDRQRGDTSGSWVRLAGGKTILRAGLNFNTNGNNTLISAAGAGIKIKVLGILLYAAGAVTLKLTNGAGGGNLIGDINLTPGTGGGFVLNPAAPDLHWIETSANTALVANLSAGVQVGGCLLYINEA